MHIVEVRRVGDDLVEPMGRMRDWLDAQRMTPRLLEFVPAPFGSRSRVRSKPQLLRKRSAGK